MRGYQSIGKMGVDEAIRAHLVRVNFSLKFAFRNE